MFAAVSTLQRHLRRSDWSESYPEHTDYQQLLSDIGCLVTIFAKTLDVARKVGYLFAALTYKSAGSQSLRTPRPLCTSLRLHPDFLRLARLERAGSNSVCLEAILGSQIGENPS